MLFKQIVGPYKVLAKKEHSYKVKLPTLIKIQLMFLIKGSLSQPKQFIA
jgi:hypothetical protein